MRDGAGTAFLAGLRLVGVLEAGDAAVDHVKIGVKFALGLAILVLVMANIRKPAIPQGLWVGLLLLTVANVAVAVFRHPSTPRVARRLGPGARLAVGRGT